MTNFRLSFKTNGIVSNNFRINFKMCGIDNDNEFNFINFRLIFKICEAGGNNSRLIFNNKKNRRTIESFFIFVIMLD